VNTTAPADARNEATPAPRVFATTRWSVVLAAADHDSPEATRALEDLCAAYWFPLYGRVRRAGHRPAEAEDLTQAFFARLLEKQWLAAADRGRGRFRSFLLGALDHFLANEWDRARAQKRGGGEPVVSFDAASAEERLALEPATHRSPAEDFDRRWALEILALVLGRLEGEYAGQGKARLFAALKGSVGGDGPERSGAELAAELGMGEGAVRVAAHRLRQRYRELLREEIGRTVESPEAVADELRHLLATFSD
jgi:RNA polymerase sigma-70 factor (ECF subfamily)